MTEVDTAKCVKCQHLYHTVMNDGVLVLFCDLPDPESCNYVPRQRGSIIAFGSDNQPEELSILAEEHHE